MNPEKELKRAYGMAVILFVVGVICYAAFSAPSPETPLRIMHKTTAGKVLFGHADHADDYGIACEDCHHHAPDEETVPKSCKGCHVLPEDGTAPASCIDCHGEGTDYEMDISADEITNNADAFHNQCGGCHEENDAGPAKKDCSQCHIM